MQTPSVFVGTRRGARPRHRSAVAAFALAGPAGSPLRRLVTNATLVVGAALVAGSAWIHLYLWADGYRRVPTIGPAFLGQGIVGLVLAVALVAFPRRVVAALGTTLMLASIGALLISATVGLFGFMDTLDAPWATTSLLVEAAGAVLLLAGAVLPTVAT
jgi:hypothetical protein